MKEFIVCVFEACVCVCMYLPFVLNGSVYMCTYVFADKNCTIEYCHLKPEHMLRCCVVTYHVCMCVHMTSRYCNMPLLSWHPS